MIAGLQLIVKLEMQIRRAVLVSASALAVSAAVGPATAAARQTVTPGEPQSRAEEKLREREAKAGALRPYEPTGLERAMTLAELRVVPILQRDGIYAKFGSLTTGSGFAYGAGFRDHSLVKGRGEVDAWAAGSLKRYWALHAGARYPFTRVVSVTGAARRFSNPEEEFTGIGPDSDRADRVAYSLSGNLVNAGLEARLFRRLRLGGVVDWQWSEAESGHGSRWPSIETRFTAVSAPGLGRALSFTRPAVFVEYDYRQPLNARRGGYYRLDVSKVVDRDDTRYSFSRIDLDLRQYISVLAERRVFAFRVLASTTEVEDGRQIPFYLLPSLGGNDTLRGFRALRFRGPHRLLLQGEYRWEIWSGLEGALFVDAGKVAMRRADLTLDHLERDYGFGFRFNTDTGVVVRVDAAFGSRDGRHLHIVFGGFF